MVQEEAKEDEFGSEKQVDSEDEEMSDPPASPPPVLSDSSSISIPPSPIPKEVLGSRGSSIRSSPSPSHSPLGTNGLNLSMTAKEMRDMLASRRKKDPRIDDRMDFRRKHEIIQTL